jgi:hypothetical protein
MIISADVFNRRAYARIYVFIHAIYMYTYAWFLRAKRCQKRVDATREYIFAKVEVYKTCEKTKTKEKKGIYCTKTCAVYSRRHQTVMSSPKRKLYDNVVFNKF